MKPVFSINNKILNRIVEISQVIGHLEFQIERDLRLRRANRIKSIHSSLAIENNSLTLEQITDIIDGNRVLGNPREIQEVKNAYEVYEEILGLNPYSQKDFLHAHSILTKDIVNISGQYRNKDVGIFDAVGNVIHIGARPQFIQGLMNDLFEWGSEDNTPELIKSCIFHYEIEAIHPFEDGNGRIGRLWQTVILAQFNPIFAWIPIETMIHQNQEAYYQVLAVADRENDSSKFIEFMLDIILDTLIAYQASDISSDISSDKKNTKLTDIENSVFFLVNRYLIDHETISTAIASELLGKSISTARHYLVRFVELGLLEAMGSNKNRLYRLK